MKKILVFAFVAFLAACNSNDAAKNETSESVKDSTTTTMPKINSPYAIGYSSDFAMDNPANAETLLKLWKAWDNGDLTAAKDMFADSVELHFADGTVLHSTRDSVVAAGQRARTSVGTAVSSVDAIIPVKSVDKNENWALIWGKEIDTDSKGKADSFYLQETWRFNSSGKADLMFQYRQAATPPKH